MISSRDISMTKFTMAPPRTKPTIAPVPAEATKPEAVPPKT